MDLTLIRHGESTGNVARELAMRSGAEIMDIPERDPDIPLSQRGVRQAQLLGRWLAAQHPPDLVLSSPYLRALETVRTATGHPGIRIDERLRDRDMGALYRLTPAGVKARFPHEYDLKESVGKFYYRPPGGESWADMALRLRAVLSDLPRDSRILISAHDAVIILIRYIVEGLSEAEIMEIEKLPVANCSISRWVDGRQVMFNEVSHLI
ncbi:histidine phosphatase family protein [Actinocorallia longicatena]|uniref:phosphoglycerate mutase (2,3-diphosphoglycerate-dependent) n=1 Tax=Actinocorallia longicatena TaxID=111803 RepID=A0ABP6QJ13_9ACTN